MKTGRVLCTVILSLLFSAAASAQSAFAPLDLWANAVKSGDTTALTQLYSIAPPAQTKTSQGVTQEVGAEPHFWAALAVSGISDLHPKVLEIEHLQPGVVALVLRIEFNLRTDSGVQPFLVEASQIWAQEGNDWRIVQTETGRFGSPHGAAPARAGKTGYGPVPPVEKAPF